MSPIRVLLIDDSPEFLQATSRFLASDPCIQVVGQSLSAQEAQEEIGRLKPDLVLMDLAMPGVNGLEATREVKSKKGAPRVIILTMHDNLEYRAAARAANADGFIPKSELGMELIPLIHTMFKDCIPELTHTATKEEVRRN